MKHLSTNELRKLWLDFWKSKEHMEVESTSLIPHNDPTLLWINSGVATLKEYFDGSRNPPKPRLTNSQKAIRTNDIENVGVTARHHTLFEMLGNFSIGEYFKDEAIEWGYEFLTKELGMHPDRLYITVYKEDTVTYKKWLSLGIHKSNIVKCGKDRNFWEIGEGPCGPCTEIFFDRGEMYDPENIGEKLFIDDIENDRYVEIWNIVFSQYNHNPDHTYTELSRKNIDTGAGLERLACVMQNVPTNFDTDTFITIINKIEQFTTKRYNPQAYFDTDPENYNISFKVVADHIRASVFAISDGAVPSNKDRGYIIRKLIRRSAVHAMKLGIDKPMLSEIVDVVVEVMKDYYPYLIPKQEFVKTQIEREELKFAKTLHQGYQLLEEAKSANSKISGQLAFKLFDTYGFPIDLTKEYAQDNDMTVDMNDFEKRLARHQHVSKGEKISGGMNKQSADLLSFVNESKFHYDRLEMSSKVIGCFDEDFNQVSEVEWRGWVILDNTSFFAESGGQVADEGTIEGNAVLDVKKTPNGQHMHLIEGDLQVGQNVAVKVNANQRLRTSKNHSATHLLHHQLKLVVSIESNQAGAYYDSSRIRFDFNSPVKVTNEHTQKLEAGVRRMIEENIPKYEKVTSLAAAIELGAMALFGDKYGNEVRVIQFGHSIELCAGTHVPNTATIEDFIITSTESKGSGVYRIEAMTGKDNIALYVKEHLVHLESEIQNLKLQYDSIGLADEKISAAISGFVSTPTVANLRKQRTKVSNLKFDIAKLKIRADKQKSASQSVGVISRLESRMSQLGNGLSITVDKLDNVEINAVREAIDTIKNKVDNSLFAIAVNNNGKWMYITSAAKGAMSKCNAKDLITFMNDISKGRGGGRPDLCQGGAGNNEQLINKALSEVADFAGRR